MINEAALSWLAGVLDAEGSFGLRRHKKRKTQVTASGFFGMADSEAVERAKGLAEEHYGKALVTHRRAPTKKSKQPFFSFNMTEKRGLYDFLNDIIPYLRIKRAEALLQYDFLSRAAKRRHVGTDHDFWLCDMSSRLKGGDGEAARLVAERVRDDFHETGNEAAWLAGYTDGDGCISMARGSRSILLSYGSANKEELGNVRGRISRLLGNRRLSPLMLDESALSDRPQWRLDVRELETAEQVLGLIRPYLFVKQIQADLTVIARAASSPDLMNRAIVMIQDLNKHRVSREEARSFLLNQGPVAQ